MSDSAFSLASIPSAFYLSCCRVRPGERDAMQFGLFAKIIEDARENKDFVLITVVDAHGSTPGKTGFRMCSFPPRDPLEEKNKVNILFMVSRSMPMPLSTMVKTA